MRVVAVSPHLDDAAFSVGGLLAVLADGGHDVTVVTCFTASVPSPTGFALACQTDKGLPPDVDYLALRREEDLAAMRVLGATPLHLPLAEAPHRGYDSAPALFAGLRPDDDVERQLTAHLLDLPADLWLAPQGLGGHVDHLQVLRSVAGLGRPVLWWRDAPYVVRAPDAPPGRELPQGLVPVRLPSDTPRRLAACACYTTQLGYQFGRDSDLPAEQAMRVALEGLDEPLLADPRALELLAREGLLPLGAGAPGPAAAG